jgi:hypothetical protein
MTAGYQRPSSSIAAIPVCLASQGVRPNQFGPEPDQLSLTPIMD